MKPFFIKYTHNEKIFIIYSSQYPANQNHKDVVNVKFIVVPIETDTYYEEKSHLSTANNVKIKITFQCHC